MSQPDQLPELYHFEACPFCSKVRKKLEEMKIDYISRPINPDGRRQRVKDVSGQTGVPLLVDPNTDTVMPESDDIVDYLEEQYGNE